MKKLLNSFKTRAFRVGGYSVIAAAIVIAIVIVANVVVNALPTNIKMIDLSQNLLYSFSDQTRKIVSEADRQVVIYWICQAGYENSTLENVLDRYEELSDKLSVVPIDTNNNPTFAETYNLSEVSNNSLLVASDLRFRYIDAAEIIETTGMYDKDGNYLGTSASLDGEQEITSAINYCLMKTLPKVYQTTGHGESYLPERYVDAVERLNLTIEDLNLLLTGIPADCDTLMMIDPKGDISRNEYELLSGYLEKGGRMILVTSPRTAERPNIDELMSDYCMREETGILAEGDSTMYAAAYDQRYLLPEMTKHTITQPLIDNRYVVFMPISSGIVRYGNSDYITLTRLLTTSSSSYSKVAGYQMSTVEMEEGDLKASYGVCVLAEKVSPDYSNDDTMVVWFSSASIVDEKVDTMVSGGNMDMFLNSLSYICEQTNSISIHSKSLNYRYLNVSGAAATLWSVILIGVIPVACLTVGLVIFLRRRKK